MQKFGFTFLCLLVVIISAFTLSGCTKQEDKTVDEKPVVNEQEETPSAPAEEDTTEPETPDTTNENEEVVSTDFSKFTSNSQEIGSLGSDEYKLEKITDTKMSGFHRIVFSISSKDDKNNLPNVLASYRADSGVIRVSLNMLTTDASGIAYQKSREIGEQGVLRIYHNVSSNQEEEIYDIGVSKSTTFLLSSEETSAGNWDVTLDVRYPGETNVDVDMGSTDFSQDKQEIIGGTSSDGAKVSSYSYGASSGILSFVWSVKGSDAKPIPSVSAEYVNDNELVVTFSDLSSDVIASSASTLSLYGGVEQVSWTRSGNESKYTFKVTSKRDFKLKSSLSPNQVVLEIGI